MSNTESDNRFIKKIYYTALFPNVIAVLGGTVNVLFDAILVGQKLGENGLSAVNQCLPMYLILCTIGSLFSSGASFLSSIAIGRNDKKEGQRIFRAALTVATLFSLGFCAVAYVCASPIARLLSTAGTYEHVLTYLKITLIGGVFKVLLYVPFFYLRLEGKNQRSSSAMLTMTVLNIVLDYVFLFPCNFGIAGAAWASVTATAVACIMSFVFLFTDHSNFLPGIAFFRKSDWKDVLKYGSPMALNNVLSSARMLVINLILKSTGMPSLIAIFAVANNLNEFSICIQNGVPQTASAMTGIFFGEKDSLSVKRLLNVQLVAGTGVSAVFAFIASVLAGKMGMFFGLPETPEYSCVFAVLCFAISLIFATANSTMTYFYNATGRIDMANLITACRGFIFVSLFCLLFSPLKNQIWLFFPCYEIATSLVLLAIGFFVAREKKLSLFYLLDESFEKSGQSVSFSVDCTDEKICESSERIRDFCEENEFTPKMTMAISLAIEELLTIISKKSLAGKGTMDVRVLKSGEDVILRIRSGGRRYNPVEEQDDDDMDYMGVRMITKLAKRTEYLSSLGINTLLIFV